MRGKGGDKMAWGIEKKKIEKGPEKARDGE